MIDTLQSNEIKPLTHYILGTGTPTITLKFIINSILGLKLTNQRLYN